MIWISWGEWGVRIGACAAYYSQQPPLFSERYGYAKTLRFGKFLLKCDNRRHEPTTD